MTLNLTKSYNDILDLIGMSEKQAENSLRRIFIRDILLNKNFRFKGKPIYPTPDKDGDIKMEELFFHLRTVIVDKTLRKRSYDIIRSERLHWLKFHIDEKKSNNMLIFSVDELEGIRTYIYDEIEKYVIVLEPLRDQSSYYLLSAYKVLGKDAQRDKFRKKYKRRLPDLY